MTYRISGNSTPIKEEQLINYITKNCSINDRTIINKYMKKHRFHETIQLDEYHFIEIDLVVVFYLTRQMC